MNSRTRGLNKVIICSVAYMLTDMEPASTLVRRARLEVGLSVRALADLARVPASTVSRVEGGRVDPTLSMLQRLLDAAGQKLVVTTAKKTEQVAPNLADLKEAWKSSPVGDRPEWPKLRSLLDHLSMHPEQINLALVRRPAPTGSLVMDTLLAGIAEKLADDRGISRPTWTRRVPPLDHDWITPGTPSMQAAFRRATPPQLRERRVFVDTSSLWRAA
jgi:transcriptional regulator with XRE-family HTH domain